jgi:hypothetical protein
MNQPTRNHDDLPEYDPISDVEFRQPPQVLAIVTLVLGLLSFVALFKTTLWIFPFVTIVLGGVSVFSLARNPEKIGRKAALLGIVLAVFFGSWAASRYFSRQQWLCGQARQNADAWLELIQENKLHEAHQLHLHPHERDDYVGKRASSTEEQPESDYDSFYGSSPLREFVKVAPEATVEFVRVEDYVPNGITGLTDTFVLRYVARYEEAGQPQELALRIVMRRNEQSAAGDCAWVIIRVARPGDPL